MSKPRRWCKSRRGGNRSTLAHFLIRTYYISYFSAYYTILYYTILYYTILYYTILYYTTLAHFLIRSVFKISNVFLRTRPWQFEIRESTYKWATYFLFRIWDAQFEILRFEIMKTDRTDVDCFLERTSARAVKVQPCSLVQNAFLETATPLSASSVYLTEPACSGLLHV